MFVKHKLYSAATVLLYDTEVKLLICKNLINTISHTCAQFKP